MEKFCLFRKSIDDFIIYLTVLNSLQARNDSNLLDHSYFMQQSDLILYLRLSRYSWSTERKAESIQKFSLDKDSKIKLNIQ